MTMNSTSIYAINIIMLAFLGEMSAFSGKKAGQM